MAETTLNSTSPSAGSGAANPPAVDGAGAAPPSPPMATPAEPVTPSPTSLTGQFPALMQWSLDWVIIPLWIVAGGMVIAGMVFAKQILIPLAVALLFASVLHPLVRWLRNKTGMSLFGAALFCTVTATAMQVVAGIWLGVGVSSFGSQGAQIAESLKDMVERYDWLKTILPSGRDLEVALGNLLTSQVTQTLKMVPEIAAQWILVMFMTFFFLAESEWLLAKLAHLLSKNDTGHKKVMDTFGRIGEQFVQFMVIRTLINIGLGVVLAIALWVMGVPYAFAWGVLATVLTYVPYIGPLLAAAPPILMTVLNETTVWPVLAVVAIYTVCFVLEGYVAVPVFMGKHLDLNATTVMIACLVWWLIWGEVGLVLAIPFTAAVKLSLGEVGRLREWSDLMSAENSGH
jgi:predicted PurR-regulated permease PerM